MCVSEWVSERASEFDAATSKCTALNGLGGDSVSGCFERRDNVLQEEQVGKFIISVSQLTSSTLSSLHYLQ